MHMKKLLAQVWRLASPRSASLIFWIAVTLPVLLCAAFAWLFLEQRQLLSRADERRLVLQHVVGNLNDARMQLLGLDEHAQQAEGERILLLMNYGLNGLDRAAELMRGDEYLQVVTGRIAVDMANLRAAMAAVQRKPVAEWGDDLRLQNALLRVLEQRNFLRDMVNRQTDQGLDDVQVRLFAMIFGALVLLGLVMVRLRITMRVEAKILQNLRQAEAALRKSDDRFRVLLRATTDSIWRADARFEKYVFNPPLRIGNTEPRADWDGASWAEIVHPDDREMVIETVRTGFRNRESIRWEFRIKDGMGGWRWMESRGVPVLDENDRIVEWLGLSMDVTERHSLAEQLRHAQKMEAIGQLTGGIAHDFNNMLAVILGNLELLRELSPKLERPDLLNNAIMAVERGSNLTHRLLAFGRRQSLRPMVMDLSAHLPGLLDMLRHSLGSEIEINLTYDLTPLPVSVDATQLDNAILNLAINARDAIKGAGRLTLTLDRVYGRFVDAFALGNEDAKPRPDRIYAMLALTDTGSGMTPEVMERAFDPFFTTKQVGQGTGLGLSMVHGFVRQSNGFIGAQSAPGEGTTIRIFLPVATRDEQPDQPLSNEALLAADSGVNQVPAIATALPKPGCRILLVDDEEGVRRVLSYMLTDLGHSVTEADSGKAALALLDGDAKFDLLITDIQMPGGMSGVDLACETVARRQIGRVIFISGSEPPADSMKRLAGPDRPFLRKPMRKHELAATIAAAMAESEVWL